MNENKTKDVNENVNAEVQEVVEQKKGLFKRIGEGIKTGAKKTGTFVKKNGGKIAAGAAVAVVTAVGALVYLNKAGKGDGEDYEPIDTDYTDVTDELDSGYVEEASTEESSVTEE